ncbi:hypothetical protein C8J56DRAFT_1062736 [Mycena floridula]|nr:hypothetical protein C8J56DRAFT_1062736 [Mycena floridula]
MLIHLYHLAVFMVLISLPMAHATYPFHFTEKGFLPPSDSKLLEPLLKVFSHKCLTAFLMQLINTSVASMSIPDKLIEVVVSENRTFYRFMPVLANEFWTVIQAVAQLVVCAAADFNPFLHNPFQFPNSYSARAHEALKSSVILGRIPHLCLAVGENPLLTFEFATLDSAQKGAIEIQRLCFCYVSYVADLVTESQGQGELCVLNWGARLGLTRLQFLQMSAPGILKRLRRRRLRKLRRQRTAAAALSLAKSQCRLCRNSHDAKRRVVEAHLAQPTRTIQFIPSSSSFSTEGYHPSRLYYSNFRVSREPFPEGVQAAQLQFLWRAIRLGGIAED